jgi:PAS domain S-box-containing protein
MSLDFGSWLREHGAEVEARWLAQVQELPAYGALPADERLSCWGSLVEALLADQTETLVDEAQQWADREMSERGAAPSELLSITEGLSRAVRDLLSAEGGLGSVNAHLGRLNTLDAALARRFADEAERLTAEKSQLETLYEITRELAASLDLGRMLHRTLAEVTKAITAEMGAVLLADSEVGKVVPETTINWDSGGIPLAALPSAWQLGQADGLLVLNDVQTEQAEAWVDMLAGSNACSLMAAPLVANGALMGVLAVASARLEAFSPAHVRLFRAVLGQIATAIGNVEVYRLVTQQAQEMGQMLRHQQEEAIKSQAILTSIADGVVVNSAEGQTILVNPAAERILDAPGEQLVGQDFRVLFSVFGTQGRDEAITAMDTLLGASVSEVHKAFKMVLEIDSRIIHAHLARVLTQQGESLGVVTVFRDITKEVEADRAKSEFVSTVSHELRTPMTAIKGYTDLLHAGAVGSINEDQERFLGVIRNNADRLTALINDLLDISRVETGRVRFEPKLMQIGEVIADVVNALAVPAEAKHQTLTYEVVGGLPDVMGDRDRLNQVLTNLVGNAIYYTPEGGEIEVRAYSVERAVRVDVRDTGIGIAPDDMGRIFERFYRADHPLVMETAGTGLGLSISRMFVEMHGGRVWVESDLGKGSTFTFILPVPVQEEEEGPSRRVLPRLMARTRTILVVDDDPDIAGLIKIQLEDSGYRVFVLGRGRSVVSRAEAKQPDLIILDLILPDMEGLDVLRALRGNATTADIPVVVLTIREDDGTAWSLGAVDYLTKPVESRDLLQSVEKALTWQGRMLVVEDDADTRGLLSATVRKIGFTPLVAANGYEALAMARRYRPDLILLDLRLPGMDGYEALTHLKRDAVTQTIPIIAISAHVSDTDEERKRLIALGAASFLPKPFSIEELLTEVETALQPVSGPASL